MTLDWDEMQKDKYLSLNYRKQLRITISDMNFERFKELWEEVESELASK